MEITGELVRSPGGETRISGLHRVVGRILDPVPDLDRTRFPGVTVAAIVLVLLGGALLSGPDDAFRSLRRTLGVPGAGPAAPRFPRRAATSRSR